MEFCTLGMFIIDDIYPFDHDLEPHLNVVGGAGTYSAVGARLFSPPPESARVGWIIDAGHDFPEDLKVLLNSWKSGIEWRARDGATTRGWNGYSENDTRAFKYLTEKKRITSEDLSQELLASKSFHLISSAARCIDLVSRRYERRSELGITSKTKFIWEPVPDLCVPSEMDMIKKALQYVDVVSPNHDELATLFGYKHGTDIDKHTVTTQASDLLSATASDKLAVVVRCGKEGSYVCTSQVQRWLPAYFQDQSMVRDPTGGGNGFLGGFAIGLVGTNDIIEATRWGSVSASFCIEQVGPPILNESTLELWNGCSVQDRLEKYRKLC